MSSVSTPAETTAKPASAKGGRTTTQQGRLVHLAPEAPALLDVGSVAALFDCSTRHVYRMSDAGRMPRPLKLGSLVRWSRAAVEEWISNGCPSCRKGGVR